MPQNESSTKPPRDPLIDIEKLFAPHEALLKVMSKGFQALMREADRVEAQILQENKPNSFPPNQ